MVVETGETLSSKINPTILCKSCTEELRPRISDLPKHSGNCRKCADKLKPKPDEAQMKRLTEAAAKVNTKPIEHTQLRKLGNGAKARCSANHKDYASRGITFKFESPVAFAEYVLKTLGPKPSKKHSIDRINNDGHYESGNLRWATPSQQNSNKRRYTRPVYGSRLNKLIESRPDYDYESLRTFIKQGLTDDEISKRIKWKGCGLRHNKLRTEA
jgi:hypothetical protein